MLFLYSMYFARRSLSLLKYYTSSSYNYICAIYLHFRWRFHSLSLTKTCQSINQLFSLTRLDFPSISFTFLCHSFFFFVYFTEKFFRVWRKVCRQQ